MILMSCNVEQIIFQLYDINVIFHIFFASAEVREGEKKALKLSKRNFV